MCTLSAHECMFPDCSHIVFLVYGVILQTALKNGSKLMVIGNKPEDVKVANQSAKEMTPSSWEDAPKKEPWSVQTQHKKVSKLYDLPKEGALCSLGFANFIVSVCA